MMGCLGTLYALAAVILWCDVSSALTATELATFYANSNYDFVTEDGLNTYNPLTQKSTYKGNVSNRFMLGEAFTESITYFYTEDVEWGKSSNRKTYHVFCSNGIPDYSFVDGYDVTSKNSHEIAEKEYEKCIPESPTYEEETSVPTGPLGFAVNGVPMYHYNTSSDENAVLSEGFDTCGGHPDSNGRYHYHGWLLEWNGPNCLYNYDHTACPAPLVGVGLDGYPIYGPQKCNCEETDSDGNCISWPSTTSTYWYHDDAELDECNGRSPMNELSQVDDSDKTSYEYRLTADEPYHMGCLHGATVGKCMATGESKCSFPTVTRRSSNDAEKQKRVVNKLYKLLKDLQHN